MNLPNTEELFEKYGMRLVAICKQHKITPWEAAGAPLALALAIGWFEGQKTPDEVMEEIETLPEAGEVFARVTCKYAQDCWDAMDDPEREGKAMHMHLALKGIEVPTIQ